MADPPPTRLVCVAPGEEARVFPGEAPDEALAEVRSSGPLPLRVRSEARHHARPAFPGTAVEIEGRAFEVVSESEGPGEGRYVYRLRAWPRGEVTRGRVVYGPDFVRSVTEERDRDRARERVRPWRHFLYPVVGALPEEQQERACERLGLYAVTATAVSGLCESLGVLVAALLAARGPGPAAQIALVVTAPGLMLLVLPGLSRAAGAVLFREARGSPVLGPLAATLVARFAPEDAPAGSPRLTRRDFWERLSRPDRVERRGEALVFRGDLPHLSWTPGRNLEAGGEYWRVLPEEPVLDEGRVVYSYAVELLTDPAAREAAPPLPPAPTAYADEVREDLRREWDDWNRGFAWLTTLFSADRQARAFDHAGGPAAAARATRITAGGSVLLGGYLLSFLPDGPDADPLAPFVLALGLGLAADGLWRLHASWRGRYAPSLLRFVLPAHLLRPEGRPYAEHREAERLALEALGPVVQPPTSSGTSRTPPSPAGRPGG
jgi:hypothetical protein